MGDRTELFSVARAGTKLSLNLLDGEAGICITNLGSHVGVAVPITREDALKLGRSLIAHATAPVLSGIVPCARCGEPATAKVRRLYQAEYEAACNTCLRQISYAGTAMLLGAVA
jgi:hypothetical protein